MNYERFTVRSAKGLKLKKGKKFVELFSDKELILKALNRLAEYEDKLESEQLVDLNRLKTYQLSVGCKGTSLENYCIDEIIPYLIQSDDGKWELRYKDGLCMLGVRTLIGYFSTKEAAKARLKELQEGK